VGGDNPDQQPTIQVQPEHSNEAEEAAPTPAEGLGEAPMAQGVDLSAFVAKREADVPLAVLEVSRSLLHTYPIAPQF